MGIDISKFDKSQLINACGCLEQLVIDLIFEIEKVGGNADLAKRKLEYVHAAVDGLKD